MKQKEPVDIPVYLFVGFLDSGKTRFIQETLEDPRFNSDGKTLLLLCEEGECEYSPDQFACSDVYVETLEDKSEFSSGNLDRLLKKNGCTRVIIEYNGMWLVSDLMRDMPADWVVYQCFFFADARSILSYNANMRQLVYDKLQYCELAVFNRFSAGTDKMELHKMVRGVTRRADIAYESPDGSVSYDDIEDPLPFDIDAPIINIEDRDYALWYRDMAEELKKYEGKTVRFTGLVTRSKKLPPDSYVIGRRVMTCCEADIRYMGLICIGGPVQPERGAWMDITARIAIKWHKAYGKRGPVLTVLGAQPASVPEPEVATFY